MNAVRAAFSKVVSRVTELNPIVALQVRAHFRGRRMFVLQGIGLLIMSGAILVIWLGYEISGLALRSYATADVGRTIFIALSQIQLFFVLLATPAFAAVALSGERERNTYEMLVTTRLKPRQIVLGKLVANMIYVLYFLVSAIPLVALIFFFGGVSPLDLLYFYVAVCLLALLASMIGLSASARFGTARSVGHTYAILLVLAFLTGVPLGMLSFALLQVMGVRGGLGSGTPFFGTRGFLPPGFAAIPARTVLLILAVEAFVYLLVFFHFFNRAVNALKDVRDNKSTNQRLLFTFFILGAVILASLGMQQLLPGQAGPQQKIPLRTDGQALLILFLYLAQIMIFLVASAGFPTEGFATRTRPPNAPRWHRMFRPLVWLFNPGSMSGLALVLALAGLSIGISALGLASVVDPQLWSVVARTASISALVIIATSLFGVFLATLGVDQRVAQGIFAVALLILIFAPLPSMYKRAQPLRREEERPPPTWASLVWVNPMLCLPYTWTSSDYGDLMPQRFLIGRASIPAWTASATLYGVGSLVLAGATAARVSALRKRRKKLPNKTPDTQD